MITSSIPVYIATTHSGKISIHVIVRGIVLVIQENIECACFTL